MVGDVDELEVWNVREVPRGREILPGWQSGFAYVDEIKSRVLKGGYGDGRRSWRSGDGHVAAFQLTDCFDLSAVNVK